MASERRARRGGALLTALLVVVGPASLLLAGCDSEYPLAATVCDGYCRALQRGDCEGDEPASCVRDCEAGRPGAWCDGELQALSDCYGQSEPGAFECRDNHSQAGGVCLGERRAWDECLAPGSGACFDECVRQSEACQGSLDDCERECLHPPDGCAGVNHSYYACLQQFPVECRVWGQVDPRPPEEIPCFGEALAFLACYGFD